MKSKIRYNKSQGWGMDLVIALGIFSIGLVAFYIYSVNSPGEATEKIDTLSYSGKMIANTILSDGRPIDWDETNVIKIGILSDNKINETKLERFYNLAVNDYPKTKSLFDTTYDYYFFLSEPMDINGDGIGEVDGFGKTGFDSNNIDAKNLIKVSRYSIYQNKPMTVYLYVWEE